jgi:hypothetical protein
MINAKVALAGCAMVLVSGVLVTGSGCSREAGPPAPLAAEAIPVEFAKTFRNAAPNIKELAAEVSSSLSKSNYPAAYEQVRAICALPEATKDQKALAARALLTITTLLQAAQAQGDQRANEVLTIQKRYR